MSTLQAVIDELQYANLHNEEQTDDIKRVAMDISQLNISFINAFQNMTSRLESSINVNLEGLGDQLESLSPDISTEDKREATAAQARIYDAQKQTADYAKAIYDFMVESRKEDEQNFNLPDAMVVGNPFGNRRTPKPADPDALKKDSKADDKLSQLDKIVGKLALGLTAFGSGLKSAPGFLARGAVGYFGSKMVLDMLGVTREDFDKIGANIEQSIKDLQNAKIDIDVTGIGSKIGTYLDTGIKSAIDLAFAKPGEESMGAGIEAAVNWAAAGFMASGGNPVVAFLAGLAGFLTNYFSSEDVKKFYVDIQKIIGDFVKGTIDTILGAPSIEAANQEYKATKNMMNSYMRSKLVQINPETGEYELTEEGKSRGPDSEVAKELKKWLGMGGTKATAESAANYLYMQDLGEEIYDLDVDITKKMAAIKEKEGFIANGGNEAMSLWNDTIGDWTDTKGYSEMGAERYTRELNSLRKDLLDLQAERKMREAELLKARANAPAGGVTVLDSSTTSSQVNYSGIGDGGQKNGGQPKQ